MNYALIKDGVVENIIWLYPGNASDFPNAVQMGDVPAVIGDTYTDGVFYRNGERVLTMAERLQQKLEQNQAIMDNLIGGVEDVQYE